MKVKHICVIEIFGQNSKTNKTMSKDCLRLVKNIFHSKRRNNVTFSSQKLCKKFENCLIVYVKFPI